ncbi:MAG: leucine-rich repeat domain-containing protein [Planctomycetota bacterium]
MKWVGADRPFKLFLNWQPDDYEHIRWLVEHYPAAAYLDVEVSQSQGSLQRLAEVCGLRLLQIRAKEGRQLSVLRDLEDLRYLHIEAELGHEFRDPTLACLEGIEGLEVLILSRFDVTSQGMRRISRMRNLRGLGFYDAAIFDSHVIHVANLSRLEELTLQNTHVTDAGLARLSRLDRLQFLTLEGTHVTDAGLIHLETMPNLIWVDLRDTLVTDAGEAALKRARPGLAIDYLSPAFELANLRRNVDLVRQGKSTSLVVYGFALGDRHMAELAGLANLKELMLQCRHVTDDGLRHLQGLVSLEELVVICPRARGPGLAHVAEHSPLKTLDITSSAIRGDAFQHLTGFSQLETLYVDEGLDEAAIEHLKKLANLKLLWAVGALDAEAADNLRRALPGCEIKN